MCKTVFWIGVEGEKKHFSAFFFYFD